MGFVAETQMKGNIRHTEGVVGQQLAGLIQPQLKPVLLGRKLHAGPEGPVEGGFAHAAQLCQPGDAQAARKVAADVLQRGLQGHEPLPGKPGTLAQQVDQFIQFGLQKQLGAVNVPVQAGKLAEE